MTKTELYEQAVRLMRERLASGKCANAVFPSWSKKQIEAYIAQFQSAHADGFGRMDIPGTCHNRVR